MAPNDVLGAPEPTFAVHADVLRGREAAPRLKAHALSALMAVAPASFAWCTSLDRRQRSSAVITLQSGRTDVEAARRCHGQLTGGAAPDTFAAGRLQAYGATVLAVKDFEPECASAYRAFLEDQGFGDRADVCLFDAGSIVAQFALVRATGSPPFDTAELTALRRLQPLIEHAFACTIDPAQPELRALLAPRGLSERELDVAELVARGATNGEIARSLHISEATVKTHLTRVYSKVGVRTRTQLALAVSPDEPARTTSG